MNVKELDDLLNDLPGLTDESMVYINIGVVNLTIDSVHVNEVGDCIITIIGAKDKTHLHHFVPRAGILTCDCGAEYRNGKVVNKVIIKMEEHENGVRHNDSLLGDGHGTGRAESGARGQGGKR